MKARTLAIGILVLFLSGNLSGCKTGTTSTTSTSTSTASTNSTSTNSGTSGISSISTSTSTDTSSGMTDLDGNPVQGDSNATVQSGSANAAENALSLLNQGVIQRGRKVFDGRLNMTQYGGPTDGTPDKYTQAGLGNRNNRLRPSSLALSPDLIRKFGLKGGERISIKTSKGTFFLGNYDDTTGNKREPNVIDVYDPTDRLGKDNFLANIPAGQWEMVIGPKE